MVELFANSGDPNQTPCSTVSDLGLHCLPITVLGVSRLQRVKALSKIVADNILNFVLLFFRVVRSRGVQKVRVFMVLVHTDNKTSIQTNILIFSKNVVYS